MEQQSRTQFLHFWEVKLSSVIKQFQRYCAPHSTCCWYSRNNSWLVFAQDQLLRRPSRSSAISLCPSTTLLFITPCRRPLQHSNYDPTHKHLKNTGQIRTVINPAVNCSCGFGKKSDIRKQESHRRGRNSSTSGIFFKHFSVHPNMKN